MSYVPLISSSLAGPLGVKHLPRLWQKVSLSAAGKLNPDYPAIGQGYDAMVLSTLGIAPERFEKFIRNEKPSYVACEKWVAENGKLDAASIAALNRQIDQYHHSEETRKSILQSVGLTDKGCMLDAPTLNNLDDWAAFHKEIQS